MTRMRIPATFIRGGSSKGVFFHAADLPEDRSRRDAIFLQVLGSPDPYRRQLDGMGGGVSSLSKAVIISPSQRADADVDYCFAQVGIDSPVVDYSAICGNLSSAVGPFAVDEGLVKVPDGEAVVRVFNTNTRKIYHARFQVRDGQAVEAGDLAIPGVAGTGAPVALNFIEPGGAATGRLLPTGNVRDRLEVESIGHIEVSLVDATSAVIYVAAADMGCSGTESPDMIDADADLLSRLDAVRRVGAVAMRLVDRPEDAAPSAPRVAMVAEPKSFAASDGETYEAGSHDLTLRIISMERCHKVLTLSGAMCGCVAAHIEGTIPHQMAAAADGSLRLGNPSGVLRLEADVGRDASGQWHANSVTIYRTQRRLMEGAVLVPADAGRVSAAAE